MIDLSQEEVQQERAQGPIPAGSTVKVRLAIRQPKTPSGIDEYVGQAKSGLYQLDCQFEVVGGTYDGLKIWEFISLPAGQQQIQLNPGQQTNCRISGAKLRAMIDAAKGIDPKDETPQANRKRQVSSWLDMNDMEFPVVVGINKDPREKDGKTYWNNTISRIVTPDKPEYAKVMAGGEIITDGPITGEGGKGYGGTYGGSSDPGYERAPVSAYDDSVPF